MPSYVTAAGEAATIEAVERLFQRLASASLGDPMARRGLPTGNRFVATALILREFMHHLGFTSITFPERAGQPTLNHQNASGPLATTSAE